VSEYTVAGVLTIFEHGNGAGVDFSEGRSRSQFFNKRLLCLLLIYYLNPFVLMKVTLFIIDLLLFIIEIMS